MTNENTTCEVCGTDERPEKGWIYKSNDVQPTRIEGGELRFEAREGANAYCSLDCSQQADREHQ